MKAYFRIAQAYEKKDDLEEAWEYIEKAWKLTKEQGI